jgi:hypothetical protein
MTLVLVIVAFMAAVVVYAAPPGRTARRALAVVALAAAATLALQRAWAPAAVMALAGGGAAWQLLTIRPTPVMSFNILATRMVLGVAAAALTLVATGATHFDGAPTPVIVLGFGLVTLGAARYAGVEKAGEGPARAGALFFFGLALLFAQTRGPASGVASALLSTAAVAWVTSSCRPAAAHPASSWRSRKTDAIRLFGVALVQGVVVAALPASGAVAGLAWQLAPAARGWLFLQGLGMVAIGLLGLVRIRVPSARTAAGLALVGIPLAGFGDFSVWLVAWSLLPALLGWGGQAAWFADRRACLLLAAPLALGQLALSAGLAAGPLARAEGVVLAASFGLLLGTFPRRGSLQAAGVAGRPHALAWWLLAVPPLMASLSNLSLLAGRAGGAPYFRTVLGLLGVLTALTAAVEGVLEPDLRRLADHAGRVAVGLVLVGMASMRPDGVAGAVLLGIDLLLGRALLVALAELTERRRGRAELEYLAEALPAQARVRGALLVGIAALSGAPPFVGFAARLLVYRAGFDTNWPITVLAVAAGALWFYAMARVLVAASILPPRTRAVRVSRSALALAWLPAATALVGGVQPGRLARWLAGLGG